MEHSFDIKIAQKYGILEAIIFKNIYFWIEKNKANEKHFYDDNYWTYNSKKAFSELFPYTTSRQIDYALKKLIDAGIIITGNYNSNTYDRTLWYSITKQGYCILQNCEMETTKLLNGNNKIVEPIPDSKPKINQIENKYSIALNSFLESKSENFKEVWNIFLDVRNNKKGKDTDYALYLITVDLQKFSSIESEQIEIINNSIKNKWTGVFQLKGKPTETENTTRTGIYI